MKKEQRQWTARLATSDDIAEGAPALARAFGDDPLFNWIVPNDATTDDTPPGDLAMDPAVVGPVAERYKIDIVGPPIRPH